jgi:hypothetical protein
MGEPTTLGHAWHQDSMEGGTEISHQQRPFLEHSLDYQDSFWTHRIRRRRTSSPSSKVSLSAADHFRHTTTTRPAPQSYLKSCC